MCILRPALIVFLFEPRNDLNFFSASIKLTLEINFLIAFIVYGCRREDNYHDSRVYVYCVCVRHYEISINIFFPVREFFVKFPLKIRQSNPHRIIQHKLYNFFSLITYISTLTVRF